MPSLQIDLLSLIFTTVLTPQKSDESQSLHKACICQDDFLGWAVVVFLRAYEETMKYERRKKNWIRISISDDQ